MLRRQYEIRVSLLPGAAGGGGRVRAFIDPDPVALDREFEVAMVALRETAWVGRFDLEANDADHPYYRVGMSGPPECGWMLSIRELSSRCLLIRDGDRLDGAKTWLLGSWDGSPAIVDKRASCDMVIS